MGLRSGSGFAAASATDYLSKFFWFKNETVLEILVGTGDFGRLPGAHIPTDNGWAFIFNGIGLIGIILSVALAVSLLGTRRRKNPYFSISLILLVCLGLYHLKESILFGKYFIALPVCSYVLARYYDSQYALFSASAIDRR